jgi:hypothetical protein
MQGVHELHEDGDVLPHVDVGGELVEIELNPKNQLWSTEFLIILDILWPSTFIYLNLTCTKATRNKKMIY